ncbi:hypothetical protein [Romboutsia sp.]|uniref:hypothetical protein n=1 Tax=Romboutsia sp. TaxID=1965302 RepID=UPI003F300172
MEKYLKHYQERMPLKGVILMYGITDYLDKNVFVVNTSPTVLIEDDHGYTIEPADLIGEEVEYLPIKIEEEKQIIIGSLKAAEKVTNRSVLNREKIIVKSAIITDIYDWGALLLVNNDFIARLLNSDYFCDVENNKSDMFRGGRLLSILKKGDWVDGLTCEQKKHSNIISLYRKEKVDISKFETYPLKNISEIYDGVLIEGTIRDIHPTGCYVKIAPKCDALCPVPEHIDLDMDVMPEDTVLVKLRKSAHGVRGKILNVTQKSNFRFEEMDGENEWY